MKREPESLADVSGRVFGVRLHGTLPPHFLDHMIHDPGFEIEPQLEVSVAYRTITELPTGDERWVENPRDPATSERFAVLNLDGNLALSVEAEGTGVFRIEHNKIAIEWLPPGTAAAHYFFSYALPLWLETRGSTVLHASAVTIDSRAVAFLGRSGVGKSTLCAELVRSGSGFVTDDGLALRTDSSGAVSCFHGPPHIRLWPSALGARLHMAADGLERVHATNEKRQLPALSDPSTASVGLELASILVLDRTSDTGGSVEISPCTPLQSMTSLIEHSVAGAPAAAIGHTQARLDRLAAIAERVPVRLLNFPSGVDSSKRIRDAISRELARTRPVRRPDKSC